MLPARNDAYQCDADVKNLGYVRVFDADSAHAADQEDVVICKLGLERWWSKQPEALRVSRILSECAPFKVSYDVIRLNRIDMVDDGKVIGVGDESNCNQPVDVKGGSFVFFGENQARISSTRNLKLNYLPDAALNMPITMDDNSGDASYASNITDFVATFETNYRSPFFRESGIHTTGCPSDNGGLAIKGPSHAATFGGSDFLASASEIYNRRLQFR